MVPYEIPPLECPDQPVKRKYKKREVVVASAEISTATKKIKHELLENTEKSVAAEQTSGKCSKRGRKRASLSLAPESDSMTTSEKTEVQTQLTQNAIGDAMCDDDGIDEFCFVCGLGGQLILCDFPFCKRAYHQVQLLWILSISCNIDMLCGAFI